MRVYVSCSVLKLTGRFHCFTTTEQITTTVLQQIGITTIGKCNPSEAEESEDDKTGTGVHVE